MTVFKQELLNWLAVIPDLRTEGYNLVLSAEGRPRYRGDKPLVYSQAGGMI